MRSNKFKADRLVRCSCGQLVRPGKMHYPGGDPEEGAAHVASTLKDPESFRRCLGQVPVRESTIGQMTVSELQLSADLLIDGIHWSEKISGDDTTREHKLLHMVNLMLAIKHHSWQNPF